MEYDITITTTSGTHVYPGVKKDQLRTWIESMLKDEDLVMFRVTKTDRSAAVTADA